MILPITAFSPGSEPDFRAEGPDTPQAKVVHDCEWFHTLSEKGKETE